MLVNIIGSCVSDVLGQRLIDLHKQLSSSNRKFCNVTMVKKVLKDCYSDFESMFHPPSYDPINFRLLTLQDGLAITFSSGDVSGVQAVVHFYHSKVLDKTFCKLYNLRSPLASNEVITKRKCCHILNSIDPSWMDLPNVNPKRFVEAKMLQVNTFESTNFRKVKHFHSVQIDLSDRSVTLEIPVKIALAQGLNDIADDQGFTLTAAQSKSEMLDLHLQGESVDNHVMLHGGIFPTIVQNHVKNVYVHGLRSLASSIVANKRPQRAECRACMGIPSAIYGSTNSARVLNAMNLFVHKQLGLSLQSTLKDLNITVMMKEEKSEPLNNRLSAFSVNNMLTMPTCFSKEVIREIAKQGISKNDAVNSLYSAYAILCSQTQGKSPKKLVAIHCFDSTSTREWITSCFENLPSKPLKMIWDDMVIKVYCSKSFTLFKCDTRFFAIAGIPPEAKIPFHKHDLDSNTMKTILSTPANRLAAIDAICMQPEFKTLHRTLRALWLAKEKDQLLQDKNMSYLHYTRKLNIFKQWISLPLTSTYWNLVPYENH